MKTNFDDVKNKCEGCEYSYYMFGENTCCALDDKVANAYGCNRELLGNNAEPVKEYPDMPDDEPNDNYDEDDLWLHEKAEKDMGAK